MKQPPPQHPMKQPPPQRKPREKKPKAKPEAKKLAPRPIAPKPLAPQPTPAPEDKPVARPERTGDRLALQRRVAALRSRARISQAQSDEARMVASSADAFILNHLEDALCELEAGYAVNEKDTKLALLLEIYASVHAYMEEPSIAPSVSSTVSSSSSQSSSASARGSSPQQQPQPPPHQRQPVPLAPAPPQHVVPRHLLPQRPPLAPPKVRATNRAARGPPPPPLRRPFAEDDDLSNFVLEDFEALAAQVVTDGLDDPDAAASAAGDPSVVGPLL
mmetsp:Transcript_10799/g.32487  ORF Transcript_10799/g.32487 Transcript_10799/m.32487 type:complete len:275 (-) Transcript_10799:424-1248(-)